jgi:hypothetical protein
MTVSEFDIKNEPMKGNLKRVGAADDLPVERRVQILQQKMAEFLTTLQKAGIKTEL